MCVRCSKPHPPTAPENVTKRNTCNASVTIRSNLVNQSGMLCTIMSSCIETQRSQCNECDM